MMQPFISPEIIKEAMHLSGHKQHDFSKLIGKSQAQLSKYLSGKTEIPASVIIHCMNILRRYNQTGHSTDALFLEILELKGEEHRPIREALMSMIAAYKIRS